MENYVVSPFMGGLFNVLMDRLVSPEMKDFLIGRDPTALLIDKLKLQMLAIRATSSTRSTQRLCNRRSWSLSRFTKKKKKNVESEAQSSNITETQSSNVTETQSSNVNEVLHSAFMSLWSKTASLATSLNPFHEGIDLKINNLCQRLLDLDQQMHHLNLKVNESNFSLE
ncbi:hypothetical protein Ancab_029099 [Ancistrocladus abbreviatus]